LTKKKLESKIQDSGTEAAKFHPAEIVFSHHTGFTMGSVASELKSEREKRKISLAQIAADTRISLRYLQSLEEGRYGDLPGGMYNRAFLRAYCESLNLNQQEIMRRYEAEISPPLDRPLKSKTLLSQKNAPPRLSPLVVWSLMLLVSATGIFFSRKWIATVFSPYFSHGQEPIVPNDLARQPAALPTAQQMTTVNPAPPPAQAAAPENKASTPVAAPEPRPVEPSIASAQAPVILQNQETESPAFPSASALRLEIAATENCWISVDRDGSPAVRKLLVPGEVQQVKASEQFSIILGNAGGVRLRINGKATRSLGKSGEVIKIQINEKNLPDFLDQTSG
jgi:cytoskeleton protein RodZ